MVLFLEHLFITLIQLERFKVLWIVFFIVEKQLLFINQLLRFLLQEEQGVLQVWMF